MTTILVPLDGSELAERALPYAFELARATAGRLLLVRAVQVHAHDGEGLNGRAALLPPAQAELERVAERLRAVGVRVDAHVEPGFTAAGAILTAATEHHVDLLVMSTHGRGGVGRFLYGSVANEVLRGAAAPVLLVSAGCDVRWPPAGRLRVLVPLDGSDLARRAFEPLATLARARSLELVLLRAVTAVGTAVVGDVPTYALSVTADPETELAAAREELDDEAGRLAGRLEVAEVRVEQGRPAAVIAALAGDERAHLIAMSTHGRGGLSRLVMGSVAAGTLQHANVPLLLVPAAVRDADLQHGPEPRSARDEMAHTA